MKNKLILGTLLIFLSILNANAQGDWLVGDQSYTPSIQPLAQGIPSSATLTVEGAFTWLSVSDFVQNAHGMSLTYELPICLEPSTGMPQLFYMDNTIVQGVTFTPTATGYIANFSAGTTFPKVTKVKFRISNLEIKDDVAYTSQQVTHSVAFQNPTAGESTSNNSATISFNTFVISTPLPIQLLDFKAILVEDGTTHRVKLDWSTVSEINSAFFLVQRSSDGVKWADLAKVEAAGNSSSRKDYKSYDDNPLTGISFYRLKLVDVDNKFNHSKVEEIVWKLKGDVGVRIHPNPTTDALNISLNLQEKSLIEIKLLSIDGRVVQSATAWVEKGGDDLKMDVGQLANGIYNVNVYKNNQELYTGKVQKK